MVVVVIAAALASAAQPAPVCSCLPPDPWAFLGQADGAFVGRLASRTETPGGSARLRFRVERAVKGPIGDTVEVESPPNGSVCGIEAEIGKRIGLFLTREGGRWLGYLCGQVAPEELLAAAVLPAPNGRSPVALFVGGRFGSARTIALDITGRTLAYGMGAGYVTDFSVCPGDRRVAELVASAPYADAAYGVAIRELPSLRLVRTRPLDRRFAGAIRCTRADGDRLSVFVGSGPDLEQRARLERLTPTRTTTMWQGWAFDALLTEGLAYVTDLRGGLLAIDPASGSVKKLARRPRDVTYLIPNAERTQFASVAYTEGVGNPRLVVVDIRRRPASVRTVPLADATGEVSWLARGRLALFRNPVALVFGPDLRVVSRFRWPAEEDAELVGDTVFGVRRSGRLVSAKLPLGPARLVRRLPGRPYVIVSASG